MLAAVIALGSVAHGATGSNATERWTEKKANEWYAKQGWLLGFNYLPSTAVNDTEMWQKDTFDPKTIDRELAWAEQLGFNSCRVFLQYIVWKNDPEGLKKRFEEFLKIANRHHIKVMPIFFDDCAFDASRDPYPGKQDEPVPGIHNSRWVPSPGLKLVEDKSVRPSLEKYVKDIVGAHKKDSRIVVWDLYNEPGNSGMGNRSLDLVQATFAWAREAKPTQPLTMGTWGGTAELSNYQREHSDIISYHFYGDYNGMKGRIEQEKSFGRPVICTEWMARTFGAKIETELPLFKEQKVGCFQWGFVAGRTQTYYPWGSPKDGPEPKVWFHDLIRKDGTPFKPEEVEFIRKFVKSSNAKR